MKITRKKIVSFIAKNGGAVGWSKAAAGVVSLTLLTGGAGLIWNQIQEGTAFKPGKSSALQGLRSNQVMFPEEDVPGASNDSKQTDKNDDKRLEPDDEAQEQQEGKNRDDQPEGMEEQKSLMEEAQNVLVMPGKADGAQNDTLPDSLELDGKNVQIYDGTAADGSGWSGAGLSGHGTGGENAFSGRGTGSGSGNGNGNGNGSGGGTSNSGNSTEGNGTQTGGNGTNGTVTPDPAPEPEPTPTPTPDPIPEPEQPTQDPDYPDGTDGPKLPEVKDPLLITPSYKDGQGADTPLENIRLVAVPADGIEEGEILYNGAVLTDWKLLCATYIWVEIGDERYRLTEYSDYFKVGEHPQTVDGDFKVTFYFRPRTDIPWEEAAETECEYEVKYAKILLMGEADEDGNRDLVKTFFLEDKDTPILAAEQISRILDQSTITGIIPGISFSEDGTDPIYDKTYLSRGGRYTLYPLKETPVPDDMYVFQIDGWYDDDIAYIKQQILMLVGYNEAQEPVAVSIPEGIYGVRVYLSCMDTLEIPSSVHEIDLSDSPVQYEYVVSPDNCNFTSDDGLLFNKKKTEILAVPSKRKELVVPEQVEKINLESENSIQKLVLHTKKVPEVDLSALNGVKIVVPQDLYKAYLLAWGSRLGNNELTVEEGEIEETITENNAILSADRQTLYGISSEARGLYQMPDSVKTVKTGATEFSTLEEGIYITSDIENLEADSLSGDGVHTIYFTGEKPPQIAPDTFGDLDDAVENRHLQIIVPEKNRDTWLKAWGPVIGEAYAERLIVGLDVSLKKEDDGLLYLETGEEATLLQAPETIQSFSELTQRTDKNWHRIGCDAFGTCSQLKILELPETVTEIGSGAFENCENLEMILSEASGTVDLGMNPFPDGATVAFNASVLNVEDASTPDKILMYVTGDCEIYMDESDSNIWTAGDAYQLEAAGQGGTALYGLTEEEDTGKICYLIKATQDIKGEIRPPEGYLLNQIIWKACENCKEKFWIPAEVAKNLVAIGSEAFAESGLDGELVLPKDCYLIGAEAFRNCLDLETVEFKGQSGKTPGALTVYNNAFLGSGLEKIRFEDNLFSLEANIFSQCKNLKSVTFKSSTPPMLTCFYGAPYEFGWEGMGLTPDVIIEGGDAEAYVDEWQYSMVGYGSLEEIEENAEADAKWELWLELPEDQIFDEEGQYKDNILEYIEAYKKARSAQLQYEGRAKACRLLGLKEPEEPDATMPDLNDYVETSVEEIPPYELILPDEIINPDLPEIEEELPVEEKPDEENPDAKNPDKEVPEDEKNPSGNDSEQDADQNGSSDETGEDNSRDETESGEKDPSSSKGDGNGESDKSDRPDDSENPSGENDRDGNSDSGTSSDETGNTEHGNGEDKKDEPGSDENSSAEDKNSSESGGKDSSAGDMNGGRGEEEAESDAQ